MTDTQDISNDLSAWIDGELSDARSEQVAKAVQSDPALAAESDELRQVAALLRQLDAPSLPDDFAQRIAAQAIQPKPNHFPHWASICVAASVLVATGTALLIFQNDDMQPPSLAYNDESKENRIATAESVAVDAVELRTEADAIHVGLKTRDAGASAKEYARDREVRENLDDISPIRAAKPGAPRERARANKKVGKYKGRIAKDAVPGPVLSPVASNRKPTRKIGKKAGHDANVDERNAPAKQTRGRAGLGQYDAVANVCQARTDAQATVAMMQNCLPVAQTVPGGPPGQKPIQFYAFRLNQHRRPENREQNETVYAKSLEAGQQRVEGLLRYNGIELVKKNQPLLNTGQVVTVSTRRLAGPATGQIQSKTTRDSKTAARSASQVQYIVFGGQSQIKTLRSQVQVLNAATEEPKADEAPKAEEMAAKQVDSLAKKETIPSPILAGGLKPTLMSSDIDPPEAVTRLQAAKAKATQARSKQQRSALSPPPVDVLIITVEERK
jgi:hypothetical protein